MFSRGLEKQNRTKIESFYIFGFWYKWFGINGAFFKKFANFEL